MRHTRLTKELRIKILKKAILVLKEKHPETGMCYAIDAAYKYYIGRWLNYCEIKDIYPQFTHKNYIRFYLFNNIVRKHRNYAYWDNNLKRRILFLKYLLLRTYLSK